MFEKIIRRSEWLFNPRQTQTAWKKKTRQNNFILNQKLILFQEHFVSGAEDAKHEVVFGQLQSKYKLEVWIMHLKVLVFVFEFSR